MDSIIFAAAFKPVKPVYKQDTDIDLQNRYYSGREGLSLYFNNTFLYPEDNTLNNYSSLTLTGRRSLTDFLTIKVADSPYPQTFTSYIVADYSESVSLVSDLGKLPAGSKAMYWSIEESSDETVTTRGFAVTGRGESIYPDLITNPNAILPNTNLFQIELINEIYARISHNDTYLKTYLTYPSLASTTETCVFSAGPLESPTDPLHPQIFEYAFTRDAGFLTLVKPITARPGRTYILHDDNTMKGRISDAVLDQDAIDKNGWPKESVLTVRPYPENDTSINISNNWIGYEPNLTYNISVSNNAWKLDDEDVSLNEQNTLQPNLNRHDYFNRPKTGDESTNASFETINTCTTCSNKTAPGYLTHCFEDIDTNFLINTEYENISAAEIDINITPLKNHLTPENLQSKSNPFPGYYDTDFRDYFKIFSGTNQIEGDQDLVFSYSSYTGKIDLYADKLTYFHMPQDMSPWKWLNINYRQALSSIDGYVTWPSDYAEDQGNPKFRDLVGLLEAGAIAGDTPYTSDKMYKKRGDYKDNTNWGESEDENGTWLCAWLCDRISAGTREYIIDSEKSGPVWLDRYYNPEILSKRDALDATATCFDSYTQGASSSIRKSGIIDIISHLKLEPGVLYAYHHIGSNDTKNIISSFDDILVHNNLVAYTGVSGNSSSLIAPYTSSDGYVTYSFDGSTYGKTITPDSPFTDFCLSFWLHSDDWKKPFGHQILGNYTNDGIGILNDECITPFITLFGSDEIQILNTDFTVLNTITSKSYSDVLYGFTEDLQTNLDITEITYQWYQSTWFMNTIDQSSFWVAALSEHWIYIPLMGWMYIRPTGPSPDDGVWFHADAWFWTTRNDPAGVPTHPWIYNASSSWAGSEGWCKLDKSTGTIRIWNSVDSEWHDWKMSVGTSGTVPAGTAPVLPTTAGNIPIVASGNTFYNGYNPVDDFTLLSSIHGVGSNTVYKFDTKGLLTEKTVLTATDAFISTTNDKEYIYALGPRQAQGDEPNIVEKIDIKTEVSETLSSDGIISMLADCGTWAPYEADLPWGGELTIEQAIKVYRIWRPGQTDAQILADVHGTGIPNVQWWSENRDFIGELVTAFSNSAEGISAGISFTGPPLGINNYDKLDHTGIEIDSNGTIYTTKGDNLDIDINNKFYYTDNNNIYTSLSSTVPTMILTGGDLIIDQIKSDLKGNLWVLHDNKHILKLDTDNLQKFNIDIQIAFQTYINSLSAAGTDVSTLTGKTLSSVKCFDFTVEYTDTGHKHNAVLLNETLSGIDVIKMNMAGEVVNCKAFNISPDLENKNTKNITNFKAIKTFYRESSNILKFKINLKNKFNLDDYRVIEKRVDVSSLSPGFHHFAYGVDTYHNLVFIYNDMKLINTQTGLAFPGDKGKYSFTDTIDKIVTVGASPYFNNVLLCDYLKQPQYYFIRNAKIKSFRLYSGIVSHTSMKALGREHYQAEDMEWVLPTGERSHLDCVDKFFKHRTPGNKSTLYDIALMNTGITDTDLQEVVKTSTVQSLSDITPATTIVRNVSMVNSTVVGDPCSNLFSTISCGTDPARGADGDLILYPPPATSTPTPTPSYASGDGTYPTPTPTWDPAVPTPTPTPTPSATASATPTPSSTPSATSTSCPLCTPSPTPRATTYCESTPTP